MFGENFCGKYHSVDEGTTKDITFFTFESFLGPPLNFGKSDFYLRDLKLLIQMIL